MGVEQKIPKDYESIKRFKTAIRGAQVLRSQLSGIHSILLFGSVARKEAKPNSDIDIAVLTNNQTSWDDSKVMDVLLNVDDDEVLTLSEAGQFNPIVISYDDFLKKSKYHSFYAAILKDGISL